MKAQRDIIRILKEIVDSMMTAMEAKSKRQLKENPTLAQKKICVFDFINVILNGKEQMKYPFIPTADLALARTLVKQYKSHKKAFQEYLFQGSYSLIFPSPG